MIAQSVPDRVWIVIRDVPFAFEEIEKVFAEGEQAERYIEDCHPYLRYYAEQSFWALPDLEEKDLEWEERYRIVEKPIDTYS